MDEIKDIDMLEPYSIGLGLVTLTIPTFVAWQLAEDLKQALLDEYEMVPGIPTPNNPQPAPKLRLKE